MTDAHVYLRRIPAEGLLGGSTPLDRAAVERAMKALAEGAGTGPNEIAEGIVEVANAAMERALRVISVERGVDPADYHLVAFGGAGGLHVAELAERLRLAGAIIPPDPGLFSAFGILAAPVVRDRSRTVLLSGYSPHAEDELNVILDELERDAREEMVGDGAEASSLRVERRVDARYRGQSFELRVHSDGWVEAFHSAHERRYGYRRSTTVEAATARVRIEAPGAEVGIREVAAEASEDPVHATAIHGGREVDVIVVRRSNLSPGAVLPGPVIVTEYSSTTWCPPGWSVLRDRWGSLRLDKKPAEPRKTSPTVGNAAP